MPIRGLQFSSSPINPAHFDIEKVIRPNILALHPYRCARDDYDEGILLDANENALGHSIHLPDLPTSEVSPCLDLDLHRYPDPSHDEIKTRIANLRSVPGADHVFLGVGSDEVIDLLIRVCVAPGKETILTTPPTYGMYSVCAQVNDVGIVKCELELDASLGEGGESGRFSLRVPEVKRAVELDPTIKLVFLCSPGNPSGTLISLSSIRSLLDYEKFTGIVVVDEAYIDFSGEDASAVSLVTEYANLCVLQTLSKSFGLAAIRLGVAIAQPPLIQVLSNTKAPYNISTPTAHLALAALSRSSLQIMKEKVETLRASRKTLQYNLSKIAALGLGDPIGSNDANFLLIPVLNKDTKKPDNERAQRIYKILAEQRGVVVRFRGFEAGCEGCLRITVGTAEENEILVRKLAEELSATLKFENGNNPSP